MKPGSDSDSRISVPGYTIEGKIGGGGMGTVYKARQLSMSRDVAIKAIDPRLADRADFQGLVTRLKREALSAGALAHENIVRIIDFVEVADGNPVIVMEYVGGLDLRSLLAAKGAPSLDVALLILLDICRGLDHAHSHGVIHRDIKPANMIVTPNGIVKILDFGLARIGEEQSDLTQSGAVMGTPHYMSPEQARGRAVDARSDIFSVGVMAYELLTGGKPFNGDTPTGIAMAILTEEPLPLTEVRADLPEEITWMVEKMLEKKLEDRTPRISLVRETLEKLIERGALNSRRDEVAEYGNDGARPKPRSAVTLGPPLVDPGRKPEETRTAPDKSRSGETTSGGTDRNPPPPPPPKVGTVSAPETKISNPKSNPWPLVAGGLALAGFAIALTLFLSRKSPTVPDSAGTTAACTFLCEPVTSASLLIDGAPAAWNQPRDLDPGRHVLEVGGPAAKRFVVEIGTDRRVNRFVIHLQRNQVEATETEASMTEPVLIRYTLITNPSDAVITGTSVPITEPGFLSVAPGTAIDLDVVDAHGMKHRLTYRVPENELANMLVINVNDESIQAITAPGVDL